MATTRTIDKDGIPRYATDEGCLYVLPHEFLRSEPIKKQIRDMMATNWYKEFKKEQVRLQAKKRRD
jgi:hypothetical protein